MARTRRRGGAWSWDPRNWLKTKEEVKAKECEDATKKADAVCAGEDSAADTTTAAQGTAEMSGAPASTEPEKTTLGGRSRRRRRLTRRKYKGGKHRKGHRA